MSKIRLITTMEKLFDQAATLVKSITPINLNIQLFETNILDFVLALQYTGRAYQKSMQALSPSFLMIGCISMK